MAIVLLSSGASAVGALNGTTVSLPTLALPVGTNRRLVVAFGGKYFNSGGAGALNPVPTVPAITYNGVRLRSFAGAQGATVTAFRDQNVTSFFNRSNVTFLGLLEADLAGMPASGPLVSTFAPPATTFQSCFGYWFFGNCDQNERIRAVGRTGVSNANTSLAGSVQVGGTSDAVVIAGIHGNSAGSIQMTINAAPLTETFDTTMGSLTARFAGAHVLSTIAASTPYDMTYTAAAAAHRATALVGLRLAEFFPATAGAQCVATDAPFGTVAVTESTPQTVSVTAS
jgi:hypothetical protein